MCKKTIITNIREFIAINKVSYMWLCIETKIEIERLNSILNSLEATNEEINKLSTVLGQDISSLRSNDYKPPLVAITEKQKFST